MDRPPARLKGNRVCGLPADRDGGDYDSVLALRGCKGHEGRGARGPLTSHWNGFSPVCVLRCSSRPRFWLKALPHSEHVYGFSCRQWGHREPGDGARGAGRNPIPLTPPKCPPQPPTENPHPAWLQRWPRLTSPPRQIEAICSGVTDSVSVTPFQSTACARNHTSQLISWI